MLQSLVEMECEFDVAQHIYSMLALIYRNAREEACNFSWDTVPEFDKAHYKKIYRMVYDGACPVREIPITDHVVKHDLSNFAKRYTISDENGRLQYTYLVDKPRSKDLPISDITKKVLGLHVGDLGGDKLQDNFLSKSLGWLLYDIAFPNSSINFGTVPQIVRTRMFNDSRNNINRDGEKYELYDKDGALILSVTPGKTFFTRRDTARIKYPRGGIKIFDDPSVIERREILAELARRYKAKGK